MIFLDENVLMNLFDNFFSCGKLNSFVEFFFDGLKMFKFLFDYYIKICYNCNIMLF